MTRARSALAGLGLLALAFGVAFSTPGTAQVEAPFAVSGDVGERVVSQHLVVTTHAMTLAHEVVVDTWVGTTSGVWLVVDATAEARTERSTLGTAVFIDGVEYGSTTRTSSDTLDGRVVDAGFPITGSVLVELPADILDRPGARSATVRFSTDGDVRLDSVIEMEVDLTALDVENRAERDVPRAGAR